MEKRSKKVREGHRRGPFPRGGEVDLAYKGGTPPKRLGRSGHNERRDGTISENELHGSEKAEKMCIF